jgi:hypothetical protein
LSFPAETGEAKAEDLKRSGGARATAEVNKNSRRDTELSCSSIS